MLNGEDAVEYGTVIILELIRRKAPDLRRLSLDDLKAVCKYDFQIPVRTIEGPVAFKGQVTGDHIGRDVRIVINSRHSEWTQRRAILHELPEAIARLDSPAMWYRLFPDCIRSSGDILHEVARKVELALL